LAKLVKDGTLMIAEGTALPGVLNLESDPYSEAWRIVTNFEGYGLDRGLRKEGWTFVYKARELEVKVFGFASERTMRKAFTALLERLHSSTFNCLEITKTVRKRFLGFPYVSVSGHARFIKQP
jgi:hypothetical protein